MDPETVADFEGQLTVSVSSLQVPNPLMNVHVHGEAWLDAKKYPDISFAVKKVSHVKKEGATAAGDVTGILTLHGV